MTEQRRDPESVRLPEDTARRLLQRATELDASLSTQSSVADLREAARGAGISDEAFQRALDEVGHRPVVAVAPARAPIPSSNPYKQVLVAVVALGALIAILTMFIIPTRARHSPVPDIQAAPPAPPPPPATPKAPTKTTRP